MDSFLNYRVKRIPKKEWINRTAAVHVSSRNVGQSQNGLWQCAVMQIPGTRLAKFKKEFYNILEIAKILEVNRETVKAWSLQCPTMRPHAHGWRAPIIVRTADLIDFLDRTGRIDWEV